MIFSFNMFHQIVTLQDNKNYVCVKTSQKAILIDALIWFETSQCVGLNRNNYKFCKTNNNLFQEHNDYE